MAKTKLIVVAVLAGLILFCLGFAVGKKITGLSQVEANVSALVNSKIILGTNIFASGLVSSLSDRVLKLSDSEGEILAVQLSEEISLFRLLPPDSSVDAEDLKPAGREAITLEDIKAADRVSVLCRLKIDGALEGIEITVLP